MAAKPMMATLPTHTLKEVKYFCARNGQRLTQRYFQHDFPSNFVNYLFQMILQRPIKLLYDAYIISTLPHRTLFANFYLNCNIFFFSILQVKVVTCHPGWTLTDGVKAAFGEKKSYLEVQIKNKYAIQQLTYLLIPNRVIYLEYYIRHRIILKMYQR